MQIKEPKDQSGWRHIPRPSIIRFNVVKMSVRPKLISELNTNLLSIPTRSSKIYMRSKGTAMAKAFIKREQSARPRPPVPDVRGSYNSQEWGQQGGRTGPWGRTADPAGQPRKRARGVLDGEIQPFNTRCQSHWVRRGKRPLT